MSRRSGARALLLFAGIALALAVLGCARGLEGRRCFPNHTCYEELACLSERCVALAPDTSSRGRDRGAARAGGEEARPTKRDGGAPTDPSIPWRSRTAHGLAAFKGKLWLGGGFVGGSADDDWWTSDDGRAWKEVTSGRRWGPRGAFGLLEHAGSLWLVGGMSWDGSDVWSSADGVEWVDVAPGPHWAPRFGHGVVSFKGRLWVIGGAEAGGTRGDWHVFGDVWSSADGKTWTLETDKPGWSARGNAEAVVFRDRIWWIGGLDAGSTRLDEVWSSPDGKTWTKEDAGTHFGPREGHVAVVLGDTLWVLAGARTGAYEWDDAWSTTDGVHWKKVEELGDGWYPRKYFAAAAFGGRIVIAGGWSRTLGWTNGVWRSPEAK